MQILSQVPEGSGADVEVRCRKFPVQRLGQVREGTYVLPAAPGKKVKKFQAVGDST